MRKMKNGECNVRNLWIFFFEMCFDVLAFKVPVYASNFEFWIEVNEMVDIPTQILLTILLSIDHFLRCNWQVT